MMEWFMARIVPGDIILLLAVLAFIIGCVAFKPKPVRVIDKNKTRARN